MINFGQVNFENFANGVLVLLVAAVSALGIRGGAKQRALPARSAEGETETLTLAGAVIDHEKADELLLAFRTNTDALKELNSVLIDNGTASKRLGSQIDALRDDTSELRGTIVVLTNEVIRSAARK